MATRPPPGGVLARGRIRHHESHGKSGDASESKMLTSSSEETVTVANPLFARAAASLPQLLVQQVMASGLLTPGEKALADEQGQHVEQNVMLNVVAFAKIQLVEQWQKAAVAAGDSGGGHNTDDMPWLIGPPELLPMAAVRKRPGKHVRLVPVADDGVEGVGIEKAWDGSLIIRDDAHPHAILLDSFYKHCPSLAQVVYFAAEASNAVGLTAFFFVALPLIPIGVLEMTDCTDVLFNATITNTTTRPWSAAVAQTSTLSLSIGLIFQSIYFLRLMLFFASRTMLRRMWAKEWPAITIKTLISYAYAVTASTIQPLPTHIIFVVYMALLGSYFLVFDAVAVAFHLRFFPPTMEALFLAHRGGKKKHNSLLGMVLIFYCIVLMVIDISRHFLITNLAETTNVVTLNVTNPFTGSAVAYTNHELASALYWTSTIFNFQNIYTWITQKLFVSTLMDVAHYEIKGPDSDAPPKLLLVPKASPKKLVLEHAEALARGETVPLSLSSHPSKGIILRYRDHFPVRGKTSKRRVRFLGVGSESAPLKVKYEQNKFIVHVSDGFVLGKKLGMFTAGAGMVLDSEREGREFIVNGDGTISPANDPNLVLGSAAPRDATRRREHSTHRPSTTAISDSFE